MPKSLRVGEILNLRTMNRNILFISIILLSYVSTLQAQIYTPSTTIQGASTSNNVGIGTGSTTERLVVYNSSAVQTVSQYGNTNTGIASAQGFIVGIESAGNGVIWNRYSNANSFIRFGVNNAEAVRITNAGYVGIGIPIPLALLHLKSSGEILRLETTSATGNNVLKYTNSSSSLGYIGYGSTGNNILSICNYKNEPISFYTNTTERMRIASEGNVGIGTTTPRLYSGDDKALTLSAGTSGDVRAAIDLQGYRTAANSTYGIIRGWNSTTNSAAIGFYKGTTDGEGYLDFQTKTSAGSLSTAMTIYPSGFVGIGIANPQVLLHLKSSVEILRLETTSATGSNILRYTNSSGNMGYVGYGSTGNNILSICNYKNEAISFYTNTIERMRINSDGNVGIGTTTAPTYKLELKGSSVDMMKIESTTEADIRFCGGTGTVGNWQVGTGWSTIGNDKFYIFNNDTRFVIDNTGNVGIGTATPGTYKLNVAGSVRANEVVINTTGADFVFDKNYKLRSLGEVESFVKENNRLPDVPSATEMQTNGVSVSEMQTKLLQKVEELTLYMIELKKENEQMKAEIEKLKNK
jgi:hypothetical protein